MRLKGLSIFLFLVVISVSIGSSITGEIGDEIFIGDSDTEIIEGEIGDGVGDEIIGDEIFIGDELIGEIPGDAPLEECLITDIKWDMDFVVSGDIASYEVFGTGCEGSLIPVALFEDDLLMKDSLGISTDVVFTDGVAIGFVNLEPSIIEGQFGFLEGDLDLVLEIGDIKSNLMSVSEDGDGGTVGPQAVPYIGSIVLDIVYNGAEGKVVISGSGFEANPTINLSNTLYTSATYPGMAVYNGANGNIDLTIPKGFSPGNYRLSVITSQGQSNNLEFDVTASPKIPRIHDIGSNVFFNHDSFFLALESYGILRDDQNGDVIFRDDRFDIGSSVLVRREGTGNFVNIGAFIMTTSPQFILVKFPKGFPTGDHEVKVINLDSVESTPYPFYVRARPTPNYPSIGYGCTNAFWIDRDCDGYGVGGHDVSDQISATSATPDNIPDVIPPLGPDANDFDPLINTPVSAALKYGGLDSRIDYINWLKDLKCLDDDGGQFQCYGHQINNMYFVSIIAGNDATGSINDPTRPFRSFNALRARIQPGDVIIFREGYNTVYAGTLPSRRFRFYPEKPQDGISILNEVKGTKTQPILFITAPGERVRIAGWGASIGFSGGGTKEYLIFDGMELNGASLFSQHKVTGIALQSPVNNITFRNLESTRFPTGIFGSTDIAQKGILVDSVVIHDSQGGQRQAEHGIYLNNAPVPGGIHADLTIKDSLIYRRNRHGLQLRPPYENLKIIRNIIHTNAFRAVEIKGSIVNSEISNNLFFNNARMPILINKEMFKNINFGAIANLKIFQNTLWQGNQFNGMGGSCWINFDGGCKGDAPSSDRGMGFITAFPSQPMTNMQVVNNLIRVHNGPFLQINSLKDIEDSIMQNNWIHSLKNNGTIDLAGIEATCLWPPSDNTWDDEILGKWCVGTQINRYYSWSLNSFQNKGARAGVKNNYLLSATHLADIFTDVSINYALDPGRFDFNPKRSNVLTDNANKRYTSFRDIRGNLRTAVQDVGAYEFGAGSFGVPISILPSGKSGVAYSYQLPVLGGTPPYKVTLSSGNLPIGITLNSIGLISGTPSNFGTFNFKILVLDSSSPQQSASKDLTLVISNPDCIANQQQDCSLNLGVCSGAKETCSGGTWPGCSLSTYTSHNTAYQATESSCSDTQDNDCDGFSDCDDSDCYSSTSCLSSKPLKGSYYNGQTFTTFVGSRVDNSIDFTWLQGSPMAGVNVDDFSVRWEGFIDIKKAGTYTFYSLADDRAALHVNNQLIFVTTAWNQRTSGQYTFANAGQYPFKMEFIEINGDANVDLEYECSTCGIARTIIPPKALLDKGGSVIVCVDGDKDGYGSNLGNGKAVGCTYEPVDCDDSNPAINPGATEICGNQIDEDCSGKIDDHPSCVFDFEVSVNPALGEVVQDNFIETNVLVTKTNGLSKAVTFTTSGVPNLVNARFTPSSCIPVDPAKTCTSKLRFDASPTAVSGTSTVRIDGKYATLTKSGSYALTVKDSPPTNAPILSLISPNSVPNSYDTIVKIEGIGFTKISTLVINGVPLSLEHVITISPTLINYRVGKNAPAGIYQIKVLNSDTKMSNVLPLTIVASTATGGAENDFDGDGVYDLIDKCDRTPASLYSRVSSLNGCPMPDPGKFSTNRTTDFSKIGDLSKVDKLSLYVAHKGRIQFNKVVSLLRLNSAYFYRDTLNLEENIEIGDNLIYLDSENLKELNVSATLTFYNTTFANPLIFKNNEYCKSCEFLSYSKDTTDASFIVPGFSEYRVKEGVCGDKVCSLVESCSICSTDCGSCPSSNDNGGGGGGSTRYDGPTKPVLPIVINLDDRKPHSFDFILTDNIHLIVNSDKYYLKPTKIVGQVVTMSFVNVSKLFDMGVGKSYLINLYGTEKADVEINVSVISSTKASLTAKRISEVLNLDEGLKYDEDLSKDKVIFWKNKIFWIVISLVLVFAVVTFYLLKLLLTTRQRSLRKRPTYMNNTAKGFISR